MLFIELMLLEPSEILAPPQRVLNDHWATVPDLLLIPSPPARTARIRTVRPCCWMCQSGQRPMWSCAGKRPGVDEGADRKSLKV